MLDGLMKLRVFGAILPYDLLSGRSGGRVVTAGAWRGAWLSEPLTRLNGSRVTWY